MSGYGFVVGLSIVLVGFLVVQLRRRRIREKYAGLWIVLGLGVIIVCVWPNLAVSLARLVGVETPSNLVFAVSLVILLAVCIQLSVALSVQEEQSRTLAEEIALIRCALDEGRPAPESAPAPPEEPLGPLPGRSDVAGQD